MSEVQIEEATGVLSGGYIPWAKEKYPFSKLTNSQFTDASQTTVQGPSFVILRADNPPSVLAAGRKRFKHCVFISRKVNQEGDIRVWLHPDSPLPTDKPSVGAVTVTSASPTPAPAAPKTAKPKKTTAAKKPAADKPKADDTKAGNAPTA